MAEVDSLSLTTSDGHRLDADVAMPDRDPIGGAVVCHPHPLYGGDRFHPVVDALFRGLPERGFVTIRFDFRREHAGGVGERSDVVAALDALDRRTVAPLVVAGYSFGAMVILGTPDDRISAAAAVAPPLGTTDLPTPVRPTLVLTPRHDQFCAPDAMTAATAEWEHTSTEVVESADHFLVGHAGAVADRVGSWLVAVLDR